MRTSVPIVFLLAIKSLAAPKNKLEPNPALSTPGHDVYDFVVSTAFAPVGRGDCYPMNRVLVNGMSSPTIEVVQGSTVSVSGVL